MWSRGHAPGPMSLPTSTVSGYIPGCVYMHAVSCPTRRLAAPVPPASMPGRAPRFGPRNDLRVSTGLPAVASGRPACPRPASTPRPPPPRRNPRPHPEPLWLEAATPSAGCLGPAAPPSHAASRAVSGGGRPGPRPPLRRGGRSKPRLPRPPPASGPPPVHQTSPSVARRHALVSRRPRPRKPRPPINRSCSSCPPTAAASTPPPDRPARPLHARVSRS